MIRIILSFVIAFLLVSCGETNSPRLGLSDEDTSTQKTVGTWILSTSSYDDVTVDPNYILGNLANRGITHIDQLVSFELLADNSYRIANEDRLVEFVTMAIDEGIRVNLLINDNDFMYRGNYEESMSKIETLMDFNNNLVATKAIKLLGIKLRVDLERSTGWALNQHDAVYNYLYFLFQVDKLLEREKSNLLLSVDVDDVWDSGDYAISFNTKDKNFTYHIIDIVDYITVLSFSRSAGAVMEKIDGELEYLRDEQLANRIVPSLAVSPLSNANDSFYGVADTTHFWITLNELQELVADDIRVPMIMIDSFDYFDQIPPVPAS